MATIGHRPFASAKAHENNIWADYLPEIILPGRDRKKSPPIANAKNVLHFLGAGMKNRQGGSRQWPAKPALAPCLPWPAPCPPQAAEQKRASLRPVRPWSNPIAYPGPQLPFVWTICRRPFLPCALPLACAAPLPAAFSAATPAAQTGSLGGIKKDSKL